MRRFPTDQERLRGTDFFIKGVIEVWIQSSNLANLIFHRSRLTIASALDANVSPFLVSHIAIGVGLKFYLWKGMREPDD